jgi:hypothetical protein
MLSNLWNKLRRLYSLTPPYTPQQILPNIEEKVFYPHGSFFQDEVLKTLREFALKWFWSEIFSTVSSLYINLHLNCLAKFIPPLPKIFLTCFFLNMTSFHSCFICIGNLALLFL